MLDESQWEALAHNRVDGSAEFLQVGLVDEVIGRVGNRVGAEPHATLVAQTQPVEVIGYRLAVGEPFAVPGTLEPLGSASHSDGTCVALGPVIEIALIPQAATP